MGKRSQTCNKPISRRMLEKKLNELVGMSANKPVAKVTVYLIFDFDVHVPKVFVSEFYGSDMKNNLFCYLMDKSFTSRIIDIYGYRMLDMMEIVMTIQIFAGCRVLNKTNIDSRTMECFDKIRMK